MRLFDSIDSVDRAELAEEIDHRAEAFGKTQNVLLQVNIAGESTKFGCARTPRARWRKKSTGCRAWRCAG